MTRWLVENPWVFVLLLWLLLNVIALVLIARHARTRPVSLRQRMDEAQADLHRDAMDGLTIAEGAMRTRKRLAEIRPVDWTLKN